MRRSFSLYGGKDHYENRKIWKEGKSSFYVHQVKICFIFYAGMILKLICFENLYIPLAKSEWALPLPSH